MEYENQFVKLAGKYDDSIVANSTLIVDSIEWVNINRWLTQDKSTILCKFESSK